MRPTKVKTCYEGFFKVIQIEEEGILFDTIELKGDAVSVIAITDEGDFVVNYEWRPAVQKRLLSTTGGLIHPGESALESAKRELLEETGYLSKEIHLLGSCYPFAGITGQKINFIVAKGAYKAQEPALERGEWIETGLLKEEALVALFKQGQDIDGIFLSGYCLLKSMDLDSTR